jgi:hypothetical protein
VRVGGARPPPLITFTLTSKVAVYAPTEWTDTLTLFHLYQYVYPVYRADCGTVQTVLLGAVHSHVPARPTARQNFS